MFNNTKYYKWYNNIIANAKSSQRSKSTDVVESHHILPKSLGGDNSKENRVLLTPREHYICHWLLLKLVTSPQHKRSMYFAFMKMRGGSSRQIYRYSSKNYERTKKAYLGSIRGMKLPPRSSEHKRNLSVSLKALFVDKVNHPRFNVPHSQDAKLKISLARQKHGKSIMVNGEIFSSPQEAAQELNISRDRLYYATRSLSNTTVYYV